jgi:hypothetical protein
MNYELHLNNLAELEKEAAEISGAWNGDDSGRGEERAQVAGEIIGKVYEIQTLINELKE